MRNDYWKKHSKYSASKDSLVKNRFANSANLSFPAFLFERNHKGDCAIARLAVTRPQKGASSFNLLVALKLTG